VGPAAALRLRPQGRANTTSASSWFGLAGAPQIPILVQLCQLVQTLLQFLPSSYSFPCGWRIVISPIIPHDSPSCYHSHNCSRLVKKLRRQGIQSYEATNEYLEAEYLPEQNRRFAREAARGENYHVRAPSAGKLTEIFRLETMRTIKTYTKKRRPFIMRLHR
jgi:hypothetical protein